MGSVSQEHVGMLSNEEVDVSNGFEDEVTNNEGDNFGCYSEVEEHGYSDTEGETETEEMETEAAEDSGREEQNEMNGELDEDIEESSQWISDVETEDNDSEVGIAINGMGDILNIDMKNISVDDVAQYDFRDLEVAYQFYCWYGRLNGFSVRKGQVVRNNSGDILQQTFLCSRQGYREDRGLDLQSRKRIQKHETRCGCLAKFRVHIDIQTMRWYVSLFKFDHNHALLEEKYCSLLPTHRKMSKADILQIENFRKVGIRPPHMYGAFANISGGYDKIGFVKKDIYNQVGKQRRQMSSDASGALKYLRQLALKDPCMFIHHTISFVRAGDDLAGSSCHMEGW